MRWIGTREYREMTPRFLKSLGNQQTPYEIGSKILVIRRQLDRFPPVDCSLLEPLELEERNRQRVVDCRATWLDLQSTSSHFNRFFILTSGTQ